MGETQGFAENVRKCQCSDISQTARRVIWKAQLCEINNQTDRQQNSNAVNHRPV